MGISAAQLLQHVRRSSASGLQFTQHLGDYERHWLPTLVVSFLVLEPLDISNTNIGYWLLAIGC
jgi:hypothetical protein